MQSSAGPAPLILTLTLDEASQAYFNGLRQRYFPARINYLAAHLTLFHHLPGTDYAAIAGRLAALAAAQPPLSLAVAGLRSLGRGVAFSLDNKDLRALHRQLQAAWEPQLRPQDRQQLSPHVTIQNKVTPDAARQLLAELQAGFIPFAATGTGLTLWDYCGGPWAARQEFVFGG